MCKLASFAFALDFVESTLGVLEANTAHCDDGRVNIWQRGWERITVGKEQRKWWAGAQCLVLSIKTWESKGF